MFRSSIPSTAGHGDACSLIAAVNEFPGPETNTPTSPRESSWNPANVSPVLPHPQMPSSFLDDAATTSNTRQKLRQIEAERNELLRVVQEERAGAAAGREAVERLQIQGGTSGMTASNAKRRVDTLKSETKLAGSKLPPHSANGLLREVYSTDLLFLIDTTASMTPYSEVSKNSYGDHGDDPNIQFLDFTTSVDRVYSFIDGLEVLNGYDIPRTSSAASNRLPRHPGSIRHGVWYTLATHIPMATYSRSHPRLPIGAPSLGASHINSPISPY